MADTISFSTGQPIAWEPPARGAISLEELFHGEAHLESRLIPATAEEFLVCMAAMEKTLRQRNAETGDWKQSMKLYREVLKDVPTDLMEEAAMRCIRDEVWFPEAALIRSKIADEFKSRKEALSRCSWLYKRDKGAKPPPAPFVRAPLHERLSTSYASQMKYGYEDRAWTTRKEMTALCLAEEKTAKDEGREPAEWSTAWLADHRFIYPEESCPGHVASARDGKVCGRCGVHIDSLRPDEGQPATALVKGELHTVATPMPEVPAVKRIGDLDW